ncbi:SGNH/GDSL hydrolase family protein [Alicyclobacillus suci]|uniref:SGNH/GDSL hydrolase family protein n=1 Tax=Alicyclobacillus suci TaxID=2816080 RepID=UPI001A8D1B26|nr:SGNH/GDSL hydrolase family protein [Alicyclobacillus suci]
MKLEPRSKLLMIGDSITDCGRQRPGGEGAFEALGNGYVSVVDAFLKAVYPAHGIRVVNKGIGGNTVLDLQARWQADVLDQKPDYVSVMIGVNDVWRHFDQPTMLEAHVHRETYEAVLDELVASTKPVVRHVYLLSPFYLETNKNDAMRSMVDAYGESMRAIAAKHGATFVDVQAAFDAVLSELYTAAWSRDRVHPNLAGHVVIARAFLAAIGFEWQGTPEYIA